jgi:hypothetical protein
MKIDDIHKTDVLVMTKRQVSITIAVLLFAFFVSFMCGYFLGTKHAAQEFVAHINQDTLTHQLLSQPLLSESQNTAHIATNTEEQKVVPKERGSAQETHHDNKNVVKQEQIPLEAVMYAAELIGYGTKEAATAFIDRVSRVAGVELELRARHSKNNRGRYITWYQVVTKRYASKEALDAVLAAIAKKEALHDINIVTCTQSA